MLVIDVTDAQRQPLYLLDPCEGEFHDDGCPPGALACTDGDHFADKYEPKVNYVLGIAQTRRGSTVLARRYGPNDRRQRYQAYVALVVNDELFAPRGGQSVPVWIVTRHGNHPAGWLFSDERAARDHYDEL